MNLINGTWTYSASEIRKSYNGAPITWRRCEILARQGFRFIPGNNPRLGNTNKWRYNSPIRIAQTNSRYHGMSVQTLWAVRENELGPMVDLTGWND